jgi:hypothetical protein
MLCLYYTGALWKRKGAMVIYCAVDQDRAVRTDLTSSNRRIQGRASEGSNSPQIPEGPKEDCGS